MITLYIKTSEYVYHYLGFDSNSEAVDLAVWFTNVLIEKGEIKINVKDNFKNRETISPHLLESDELDGDILDDIYEGDEITLDENYQFVHDGVTYKVELR